MQDPDPSNIHGSKIHEHSVEWQVNLGHVLLGLAIVYVAAKFGPPLLVSRSGSDNEMESVGGGGAGR